VRAAILVWIRDGETPTDAIDNGDVDDVDDEVGDDDNKLERVLIALVVFVHLWGICEESSGQTSKKHDNRGSAIKKTRREKGRECDDSQEIQTQGNKNKSAVNKKTAEKIVQIGESPIGDGGRLFEITIDSGDESRVLLVCGGGGGSISSSLSGTPGCLGLRGSSSRMWII